MRNDDICRYPVLLSEVQVICKSQHFRWLAVWHGWVSQTVIINSFFSIIRVNISCYRSENNRYKECGEWDVVIFWIINFVDFNIKCLAVVEVKCRELQITCTSNGSTGNLQISTLQMTCHWTMLSLNICVRNTENLNRFLAYIEFSHSYYM